MSTLLERQQLTSAHITAVTQLSRRYSRELGIFLQVAARQPSRDLGGFIFATLPSLLQPFQGASVSIAERFAQIRAEQTGMPRFDSPQEIPGFLQSMSDVRLQSAGLAEGLIMKQRDGYNISTMNILKALDRPVIDSDRSTIQYISNVAPQVESTVVAVRGDGCAFCKMLGVRSVKGSRESANFHNFCRCVFDPSFSGEPAFRQPYYQEFEEDYERAKQTIESGEAGERVMSVGSKQWESRMRRDVQAHLRAETKAMEQASYGSRVPQEAASVNRQRYTSMTDSIMGKTLRGEPLSQAELTALGRSEAGSSFDPVKLTQPIHTPWKATTRDIAKYMESQRAKDAYAINKLV